MRDVSVSEREEPRVNPMTTKSSLKRVAKEPDINHPNQSGADHQTGWEHWQVDLSIPPTSEGTAPIHRLDRLGLRIFGLLEGGHLVDLLLTGDEIEDSVGVAANGPMITVSKDTSSPPPLSRLWRIPEIGITIQAHVWIDANGSGFADIFTQSESSSSAS